LGLFGRRRRRCRRCLSRRRRCQVRGLPDLLSHRRRRRRRWCFRPASAEEEEGEWE